MRAPRRPPRGGRSAPAPGPPPPPGRCAGRSTAVPSLSLEGMPSVALATACGRLDQTLWAGPSAGSGRALGGPQDHRGEVASGWWGVAGDQGGCWAGWGRGADRSRGWRGLAMMSMPVKLSACIAGKAGRDGGISDPLVGRDRSWANARRRRWFDGSGALPAFRGARLRAAWATGQVTRSEQKADPGAMKADLHAREARLIEWIAGLVVAGAAAAAGVAIAVNQVFGAAVGG